MKISAFIVFLVLCALLSSAQVSDTFNDGDFTNNPAWAGSTNQFIINSSKQLQLNNTGAGSSTLYTSFVNNSLSGYEWRVYVKQGFAPSDNNYCKVYLVSNQANLTEPLDGYYLQFGEKGSLDAIELFRQSGNLPTPICRGIDGKIVNSFEVMVKVTRDNEGNWKIFTDYTGGTNFTLEATGVDNTYISSQTLGLVCVYTASNSTKFYFDNFYAGPIQIDTTPPVLNSISVTSSTEINLVFNEKLDALSAQNTTHYLVSNGIGEPSTAVLQADQKTVTLTFLKPFGNGIQNQLTVSLVNDLAGNAMVPTYPSFVYFVAVAESKNDIVISEIVADPDPVIGLPAAEFIEIYNRSPNPFDVAGWKLTDGSSTATLPTQLVLPNSYWVITSSTNASLFSSYQNVLGVSNFPSLNNSGDLVLLKSRSGLTIDSLNYSLSWYRDADKQQGGWSLERIDLNGSSLDPLNWVASQDITGGTPGKQNSWFGKNPDTTPPKLVSVNVKSDSQVELVFDEPLASASLLAANFKVNNSVGNPSSVQLVSDQKTISLSFNIKFANGIENILSIEGITDLVGNKSSAILQSFTYVAYIASVFKDVIITELFADPTPSLGLPEAEFVEIYNISANPFSLAGWSFQAGNSKTFFSDQIILPHQYGIVTNSKYATKFLPYGTVFSLPNFPVLPNDGTSLIIKNKAGTLIDSLNYSTSWYRDNDKAEGGYSLELIDVNNPCGEEDNWTASESTNGGTPGKQNSVWANKPDLTGPTFVSIETQQNNRLVLSFNEKLSATSLTAKIDIDPPVQLASVRFSDISKRKVTITLGDVLKKRTLYTISLSNVYDCAGNVIQESFNKLSFALPEEVGPSDLVINEILFNPKPNGVDFVEVFNTSTKYISLNGSKLANLENGTIKNIEPLPLGSQLVEPNQYKVFTADPIALRNNYPQGVEKNFIKTSLPSLPDDAGSFALVSQSGMIIDSLNYSKNMHSTFVKDDEGISLERISFSHATNDPANWKSASAQSGFGTPGYLNSNSRAEQNALAEKITIDPEIIVPNSGVQDFAKINYQFDQHNLMGNIKILDEQGRIVKNIASNATLGYSGFFRWDGNQEDGTKARMGYYIVWIDLFDDQGNAVTLRKRVVVAGQ